jgi:hypothetical protein
MVIMMKVRGTHGMVERVIIVWKVIERFVFLSLLLFFQFFGKEC